MAITSKQFEQLNEMGISLWQSRAANNIDDNQQKNYLAQNQKSLTSLSKQKLFNDILRSLNLSIGEVKAQNDHLDAGLFNWYFLDKELDKEHSHKSNDEHTKELTISCIDHKLISPNIETIAQSAILKKQLWHTLANNLL